MATISMCRIYYDKKQDNYLFLIVKYKFILTSDTRV